MTGVSGGLGGATATALLADGWTVLAVVRGGASRLGARFADALRDGRLRVFDVDLMGGDVGPLTDEPLDAIVLIAGASGYGSSSDMTPADVRGLLELNVVSTYALVFAHLPQLAAARGALVMTSSLAVGVPIPWFGVYRATKAALEAWGASMRHELRPLGVDVYCVRAGSYRTGVAARLRWFPPARMPALTGSFAGLRAMVEGPGLRAGADPAGFARAVMRLLARRPAAWLHAVGPGRAAAAALAWAPSWVWEVLIRALARPEVSHVL